MTDLGRTSHRDPAKRNSITNRLLGSFRQARQDTAASIQRRTSSATSSPASKQKLQHQQSPISRIREWLDACNREHNHHCSPGSHASSEDLATFRPTWLIDSAERCLVRSKPTDRYVALSYVWGGGRGAAGSGGRGGGGGPGGPGGDRRDSDASLDEPPMLVKANVDVFEDALPEDDIPQTILDAMWVARKTGLRYIWVDKLCVVQDDREELESHVQNTAYIFANAYLTLVAAGGDVHTGLAPLNPQKAAAVKPLGTGTQVHEELLRKSKWNTRGWTVEENIYSRRRVFFFENAITWECHCELWQGSPTSALKVARGRREGCANPLSSAPFAYRHAPWPDLDEYARIAMDYSSRRLTVAEDTLRAFAGITNVLSRIYPGGFLYGMPLMFLDIALLWRPQASLRRRAVTQPPFLPSWSWMGWWFDGVPADLVLWRAAADYVNEQGAARQGVKSKRLQSTHAFKIKPTVTWTLTDRSASVPVANTGLQFRDLRSRRSSAAAYPPGWSREGSGFRHDSDEDTLFKYPIPVEDPPEEGDYPPPPGEAAFPGPFLSFRSQSAFFEVDYEAMLSPREADLKPPVAVGNIWTKADRWAGSFRAHDGWLGVQSSNYDGEEALEFVAISTATERKGSHVFNDEQFTANQDADGFIDIVNVLWLERIGGVAYRRGLGHILQKAWDAQPKEEVDIMLG